MVDKATLDRCLEGISFPVERQAVADCAGYNACPSDVLARIRESSQDTFGSEDQLLCSLGSSAYC